MMSHHYAEYMMYNNNNEQCREFAIEVKSIFDILRWEIGVEKVSGQKLGAHYENLQTGEIFLWDIGRSQVFQPHHHLWPIPQSEINANDNISAADQRSEERRVGKGWRWGGAAGHI